MVGRQKSNKKPCGIPLTESRCTRCRVKGKPGTCERCGGDCPTTCPLNVTPGRVCPDHPSDGAQPLPAGAAGWVKTQEETDQVARLKGMPAVQKAQELADLLAARAFVSGDPQHLEAALRAMTLWVKIKEME